MGGASWFDWGGGQLKGLGGIAPPLCMLKNALILLTHACVQIIADIYRNKLRLHVSL